MDTKTERLRDLCIQTDIDGQKLTKKEYDECCRYFDTHNEHLSYLAKIAVYGHRAIIARLDGKIIEALSWEKEKDALLKTLEDQQPRLCW